MVAALQMVQEKFQMLSPQRQVEVVDFIDFLLSREAPKSRTKMKLDWAGALEDIRDEYASIELQRQADILRDEILAGLPEARERVFARLYPEVTTEESDRK